MIDRIVWDKKSNSTYYWSGFINTQSQVELRRTFSDQMNYSQVLIVVSLSNKVTISMNGKTAMNVFDVNELNEVVLEAYRKLK